MDDSTGRVILPPIIAYCLSIFVSVSYCWYWQHIAHQCVCQHYRISLTSRHPCYHRSIGHRWHPHQLRANMTPSAQISHQHRAVLCRNIIVKWYYDLTIIFATAAPLPPNYIKLFYILIIRSLFIIIRFHILWWQRWQVAKPDPHIAV